MAIRIKEAQKVMKGIHLEKSPSDENAEQQQQSEAEIENEKFIENLFETCFPHFCWSGFFP